MPTTESFGESPVDLEGMTVKLDDSLRKRAVEGKSSEKCPVLLVLEGDQIPKKSYDISRRAMIIGRAAQLEADLDIYVPNDALSRRHAEISQTKDGVYILRDLGSTNGTQVNGETVSGPATLKDNDLISLGKKVIMKFMSAENAEIQYYSELMDQANRDGMLGIYNKKYLLEVMESEFSLSRRIGRDFSMIMLDLDFFKKVNDQYGHDAGDLVLKESARIVTKCARHGEDYFGRYGGEEFLILLPRTGVSPAREVAERVRKAIEQNAYIYQTIRIPITASLGVASIRAADPDAIAIFKRADAALYESKKNGRNQVSFG